MIEKNVRLSPFVYAVPLVVAFAVIGVAVYVASRNTEMRSHASNANLSQCVDLCQRFSSPRQTSLQCESPCKEVIQGLMTCEDFVASVSARRKGTIETLTNTCWSVLNPIGQTCRTKCHSGGRQNLLGPRSCTPICQQVLSGKQTCAEACVNPPRGSTTEQCVSKCNGFSMTPTPAPSVYKDPSTVNEIPDGDGCSSWRGVSGAIMETCCSTANGVRSCRSKPQ